MTIEEALLLAITDLHYVLTYWDEGESHSKMILMKDLEQIEKVYRGIKKVPAILTHMGCKND